MELKLCPFCGGRANQPEFYAESKTARFINCGTCGASVYRALPGDADVTLIAAWNRRDRNRQLEEILIPAPDEPTIDWLKAYYAESQHRIRAYVLSIETV